MKRKLLFILFAFATSLSVHAQDMQKVREVFDKAQHNAEMARTLYEQLTAKNDLPPVMIGYQGASAALMAKFSSNPVNKVRYLRICQELIDSAIVLDPDNFELRMLRFAIEVKTPGMFIEADHTEEDSRILTSHLLLPSSDANDFHTRIASKVLKYKPPAPAQSLALSAKYQLDEISAE